MTDRDVGGVVPDVLALALPEAVARLEAGGWRIGKVMATNPPWSGEPRGVPRVLRQQVGPDGAVDLLVAAPGFARSGARE